ncbi:MAG: hypothetical protein CMN28_09230 [Salinisphaeraceae bacterium]|nr:hypothetical protein [Salinisphaeraceae bacterium]
MMRNLQPSTAIRRLSPLIIVAALLTATGPTRAHDGFDFGGPAGHAPLGVMGDHVHRDGEWMFSYRYMRMHMDGNRSGSQRISEAEIVSPAGEGFVVAPVEMDTEMHMLGAMYAFSDRLTAMVMAPYVIKEMDHVTRMGQRFTTKSEGLGDVKLAALYQLHDLPGQSLHLNLALSTPTGAIDEEDDTPRCRMMGNCPAQLPYPMQLGSGTWDPSVGLTWRAAAGAWSGGGQFTATFRLGRNDHEYSMGERFDLTGWLARRLGTRTSVSLRLAGSEWTNYDGRDDELAVADSNFIPTAETDLRAGRRVDAGVGLNWLAGAGHRLALELLLPVYQSLDGPQLESDGMLVVGWQWAHE